MEATQESTPDRATEIAALVGELVQAAEGRAREDVARRMGALLNSVATEKASAPKAPVEFPLTFAAAPGLFALSHKATAVDVHAQLSARLQQLSALLSMTMGVGFQAFTQYSEAIQENYLWACSSLADECDELLPALDDLRSEERAAA